MRGRQRNHLIDQIIDERLLACKLGWQRVRAEKGSDQIRDVGIIAMLRDQIQQGQLAGPVQRVTSLCFERGRAVGEDRSKPRAQRSLVERQWVEQRIARSLDRVEHPESCGFASQTRGKIRLAITGEERMRVRVDKTGNDHALAQIDLFDRSSTARRPCTLEDACGADLRNLAVFNDDRTVVDTAERVKVDAALRRLGIAGHDRLRADDQRRQSIPFASAV